MKKFFFLPILLAFSLSFPIESLSQCDVHYSQLPACPFSFDEIAVFKKTATGFECIGVASVNQATLIEVDLSEVSKLAFLTICKNAQITSAGGPAAVGTICSQTFECQGDYHFYSPPTVFDPYNYPVIHLVFSDMFSQGPNIYVDVTFTECGLSTPVQTSPLNEAENTGTNVLLTWASVPQAVNYSVRVVEACFGCPVTPYSTGGTQLNLTLNANSSYFWQVKANGTPGVCDDSAWATSHFWTGTANPLGTGVCSFFEEGLLNSPNPLLCDVPIILLGNVVFCSPSSITLLPNFEVGLGISFTAKTDCD